MRLNVFRMRGPGAIDLVWYGDLDPVSGVAVGTVESFDSPPGSLRSDLQLTSASGDYNGRVEVLGEPFGRTHGIGVVIQGVVTITVLGDQQDEEPA